MEKFAPEFPTVPAKTMCVCEDSTGTGRTYVGFLNSTLHEDAQGAAVTLVCAFPMLNHEGIQTVGSCYSFTLIK